MATRNPSQPSSDTISTSSTTHHDKQDLVTYATFSQLYTRHIVHIPLLFRLLAVAAQESGYGLPDG